MKNRTSLPTVWLTVVLAVVLVVCRIVSVMAPFALLPEVNIPNMVLVSCVALLIDHILSRKTAPMNVWMPVFGALAFALLPFAAGFAAAEELVKLAITGAVVFTACCWLYDSMAERIATGSAAKAAPVFSVLGLYLAAQCFSAIIL